MAELRAALYLRVSTGEQNVDNQRRDLVAAAAGRGWAIVKEYSDAGISGAKGREKCPQFDAMLKDAVRRRFDVVMAWRVDRLGRSLLDLIAMLQELHAAGINLYLHQQSIDTTTPAGRALFGMLGIFAEFERSIMRERTMAGIARARAETPEQRRANNKKAHGHPRISEAKEAAIRDRLAAGVGMLKIAREVQVGSGTVQRVKADMVAESFQLAPNLLVLQNKTATLADIKPNDFVASAAVRGVDGKLHSTELRIFPDAMRGVGEGQRPMNDARNQTMTNATVTGAVVVNGSNNIRVKFNGGESDLILDPGIPVTRIDTADIGLVRSGLKVRVRGARTAEGANVNRITVQ